MNQAVIPPPAAPPQPTQKTLPSSSSTTQPNNSSSSLSPSPTALDSSQKSSSASANSSGKTAESASTGSRGSLNSLSDESVPSAEGVVASQSKTNSSATSHDRSASPPSTYSSSSDGDPKVWNPATMGSLHSHHGDEERAAAVKRKLKALRKRGRKRTAAQAALPSREMNKASLRKKRQELQQLEVEVVSRKQAAQAAMAAATAQSKAELAAHAALEAEEDSAGSPQPRSISPAAHSGESENVPLATATTRALLAMASSSSANPEFMRALLTPLQLLPRPLDSGLLGAPLVLGSLAARAFENGEAGSPTLQPIPSNAPTGELVAARVEHLQGQLRREAGSLGLHVPECVRVEDVQALFVQHDPLLVPESASNSARAFSSHVNSAKRLNGLSEATRSRFRNLAMYRTIGKFWRVTDRVTKSLRASCTCTHCGQKRNRVRPRAHLRLQRRARRTRRFT